MLNKAKKALFGLSIGHFALDFYAAILIPLYPLITQKLNISLAEISVVIALGHAIASILQPVFGYISDKIKKRFFMFFGLIFASCFMPLGFIAKNSFLLTCCLVLGMIGNAFYHPQTTTIIKDFYKENLELSRAIGIFLGLGTIGYALGPYISTYFLETFGENNYVFIGLTGILISFFMLYFVPKIEQQKSPSNDNFLASIKDILSNKACIFLIGITIIKALLVISFGTYVPFLLKKYGYSLTQIGLIVTLFYIFGGVSMIVSSKFEKKLKLKGMIAASYLPLLPLSLAIIFCLKTSSSLSVVFFILEGFFVLLAASSVLAHAQNLITKHTGIISGIIQGFTLAIGSLLLIPCGFLAQLTGVEFVLILISLIAFIAAIIGCKKTYI